jgi:hypothetical protein
MVIFFLFLGQINIVPFQTRYIENYQSLVELMHLTNAIKTMSFERLKKTLPLDPNSAHEVLQRFPFFFLLTFYFVADAFITLKKLYKDAKVIGEDFLRVGSYSMLDKEKAIFDGYQKFVNIAAKDP